MMTVGPLEMALCGSLLVLFVGYAVWASPAVRVLGWAALAATIARVLLAEGHLVPTVTALVTASVTAWFECRGPAPRNSRDKTE